MSRDVEFNVTATDKSGPAVKGAADGFEKLGDKADKASRKVDDLGDQSGQLARKLAEARLAATGLAREFDKVGDSKLLKDFEKANREAAKLGRALKSITLDTPKVQNPDGWLGGLVKVARKGGLIAGDAAVEGFGDAFKALGTATPGGSYVIGGLVAAAASAAPLIAGAIQGAVLAGVGTGGIAAGLILGARDPRVIHAYGDLGVQIMTQLEKDASPFTNQLLAIPPRLSRAFAEEEPRIARIFTALAPVFGTLTDDAIEAVHRLMPAIERAAIASIPVLRMIGVEVVGLSGDVANLLDAFAKAGPGAAVAIGLIIGPLRVLIELMALGAQGSAPLLNALGKVAEFSHLVPDTSGNVKELRDIVKDSGAGALQAAGGYNNLAFSLRNTADMAKQLQENFDRLFGEQMSVDQANLAVNTGLMNLTETIKGNKRTLDEHTAAGAQNVGVILQQIQALDQKRQADIAAGNGTAEATQKANGAYASQLEGLRQLLYSLGLNHAEVDKLINAYAELAKPQTKTFTTVFRTVGSIPAGYSDQSTGHSRTGANDYAGLDGWAPARFAAAERFAAGSVSAPRTPPVQVHAENTFTVLLDGQPFRAVAVRTVAAAEKRQAWRAKVGAR